MYGQEAQTWADAYTSYAHGQKLEHGAGRDMQLSLASLAGESVALGLAMHPGTRPEALDALTRRLDSHRLGPHVPAALAANKNSGDYTLTWLATHADLHTKLLVTVNENASEGALLALAQGKDTRVALGLAQRDNLPASVLLTLAGTHDTAATILAGRPECSTELLRLLAGKERLTATVEYTLTLRYQGAGEHAGVIAQALVQAPITQASADVVSTVLTLEAGLDQQGQALLADLESQFPRMKVVDLLALASDLSAPPVRHVPTRAGAQQGIQR